MKDKILDCVYFDNFSDMLESIFETIDESEDYIYATIVGKYKEISEILNLVISCYVVDIGDISLCSENCNGYKDEYALTIDNDEDLGIVVYCSPLKTEKGYLGYGADIVYILDNCNSKAQHSCENEAKFVIIGEEDCDCGKFICCGSKKEVAIEYSKGTDGKLHGFSASKSTGNGYRSYGYYTNDTLSKNDIYDMLKEFGF